MLRRSSVARALLLALAVCVTLPSVLPQPAAAQARKKAAGKKKPPAPQLPPLNTPEDKLRFLEAVRLSMPTRAVARNLTYSAADLDKSLENELGSAEFAPLISDERFIRRASLDLTGKPPEPKAIREFIADKDPQKRAKLVDKLLETKDYARKWARYWTTVIFYNSTAPRRRVNPQSLEDWLAEQFEKNVRWDRIVAELVSATPQRSKDDKDDYGQNHGPNNFVLANDNKAPEVAAETARIFMGISIQCAECHDHPFDRWKREQFHELAAFFAPGRYYMPDQDDPSEKTLMQAKFLLGEKPPEDLKADARRVAVAAYLIYNPDNYWFARAFVNRMWNELVGDGFYSVDSLGPDAEVTHKLLVNRISAMFRYREFDPKWVFRTIMNSKAYQRDIRTFESDEELFTAVRPTRLGPAEVLASVQSLTGDDNNLSRAVRTTFKTDPSIPQRDLEGSIQQALLMMNNRALQNKLRNSELKKRLMQTKDNRQLVDELYLDVLARTPTPSEVDRSLKHLKEVQNRSEAVDDLVWVLINSTEFITKR